MLLHGSEGLGTSITAITYLAMPKQWILSDPFDGLYRIKKLTKVNKGHVAVLFEKIDHLYLAILAKGPSEIILSDDSQVDIPDIYIPCGALS